MSDSRTTTNASLVAESFATTMAQITRAVQSFADSFTSVLGKLANAMRELYIALHRVMFAVTRLSLFASMRSSEDMEPRLIAWHHVRVGIAFMPRTVSTLVYSKKGNTPGQGTVLLGMHTLSPSQLTGTFELVEKIGHPGLANLRKVILSVGASINRSDPAC